MLWIFDKPLDLVAILFIGIFFLVTGYRPPWWRRKSFDHSEPNCISTKTIRDIPGPYALPIFGTRWIYTLFGRYELEKIHEAYQDMFRKYGDVVCEQALWNIPIVSVRKKDDIEIILRQNSKYPLRPPTEVISYYRNSRPDRYASIGMVNAQGEAWLKLRTALTPELTSSKTISQFVPELNLIVDDFINLLRKTRDQQGFVNHLEELANRMGLESTCALILGRRMGFLDNTVDEKAQLLAKAVQEHFCASRDTFYGLPFWKFFNTQAYQRLIKSEDTIYNIISELVDQACFEEKNTCDVDIVKSVFVSMLQADNIDIREKKAAIIDFIAAGIQTLGNTLVFLLFLIGKSQKIQTNLYQEIESLPNIITSSNLNKSQYLRACISETFRVLPTANCIARILDTDLTLPSGYFLPAGTVVLCHTALACLDNTNFPLANVFQPERWIEDETLTNTIARYLVVPFGIGRRMCPGKRFIKQELLLVLAKICREMKIESDELELQFEFLVAPKGPVKMRFVDRF